MKRIRTIGLCCIVAPLCAGLLPSANPGRAVSLVEAANVWGGQCYTPNESNTTTACTDCGIIVMVPSIYDYPLGSPEGRPIPCIVGNKCLYTPLNLTKHCAGS